MPRRKYAKKKRNYKRKKNRQFYKTSGPGLSPSFPLPKTFKFKTQYFVTVSLDPGIAGSTDSYIFRMNSLYDPDLTSVGHQPIGFDQIMAMYDHYTVIGSRAKMTFTNNDQTYNARVIAYLKDSAVPISSQTQIIENGMGRYTVLAPAGTGGSTKSLSLNCSPSKFFGRKVMQGDKYQGTSTTNPDDGVYMHLVAGPASTSAVDQSTVDVTVLIQYVAILTEPKQLSLS